LHSYYSLICASAPQLAEDAFAARQDDAWRANEDEMRERVEAALSAARDKMTDEVQLQRDEFQVRVCVRGQRCGH
jgi:hypothetical protein